MSMTAPVHIAPPLVAIELGEPDYPVAVARLLGAKAPTPLYCLGNLDLLKRPAVGFCGSRKASARGLAVADDCARQLVHEGFVVVSGYAAGVDYAAHKAALDVGGYTILVLPEGLEHFRIRKTLVEDWDWDRVLVISQFPPSVGWKNYRAMERNKLIIALSRAMIVIEAGSTGGTLHAGKSTLKMGQPLFVVQYEDMKTEAPGNYELITSGGEPVRKNPFTGQANLAQLVQKIKKPVTKVKIQMGTLPFCAATP